MIRLARRFLADSDGASAIEYSMLASLVFLAIVASVTAVAADTTAMWQTISTHI